MEGKTLSVKSRSHHRQDNRGRPYQWYHFQPFPLGNGYDIGSRICHRRTSCFRNHPHGIALLKRFQITGYGIRRGMFVQRIESHRINVRFPIYFFEETACRAHFLNNKMADARYYFLIIRREYNIYRRIAQSYWQKIQCRFQNNSRIYNL